MTRTEYRRALKGRRCYVGMDLSTTKDLTAVVAVFPDSDGCYDVLAHFFIPKDTIRERVREDRVPYDQWERDTYITATEGNRVDYEAVRALLQYWAAEFQVREIGVDPWNATDLIERLSKADGFTCTPMRQGFQSLSAPSKSLEKLVLARELRHDGHPVLRWCISNVVVEQDAAGNLKPSKSRSSERIDGVVALVMAIARAEANAVTPEPRYSFSVIGGR